MSYQTVSDEMLIKLLKTSDQKAFREIYNRYWKKLFTAVCSKLSSTHDAEEIVQAIFIDIWERRERAEILELANYLFTAVKYKVINNINHKLSEEKKLSKINFTVSKNATDDVVAYNELKNEFQKAVEALPAKTRTAFTLTRIQHYSIRETAKLMNLSEKAVEYHITQSLRILRLQLKEFVVF